MAISKKSYALAIFFRFISSSSTSFNQNFVAISLLDPVFFSRLSHQRKRWSEDSTSLCSDLTAVEITHKAQKKYSDLLLCTSAEYPGHCLNTWKLSSSAEQYRGHLTLVVTLLYLILTSEGM
ncbi:hypothetical protein ES288_D04G080900v1 [Gossypium darwinii]|uniref:Uncharacterized protein n=1 Tax=Gossypium darwinii TaxID=34276 RepID=A0A5D2CWS6_GOSDA|nr:hypothetical protein ES288_D04G080900v1 [Gossypium darwinii]